MCGINKELRPQQRMLAYFFLVLFLKIMSFHDDHYSEKKT